MYEIGAWTLGRSLGNKELHSQADVGGPVGGSDIQGFSMAKSPNEPDEATAFGFNQDCSGVFWW